jgi:hypothetical protein
MKPSQTILGPISSLSPEFSDLSMETDSAGKRRERSASLVGASREHRARAAFGHSWQISKQVAHAGLPQSEESNGTNA